MSSWKKNHEAACSWSPENSKRVRCRFVCACFLLLMVLAVAPRAFAADSAILLSQSISNGTPMLPRTVFTQTWTFQNNGTTTWTATYNGYTLNIVTNNDCLGGMPRFNKTSSSHTLSTAIDSGKSVAPGGQCTYTMSFTAPERPGSYTNIFQLNSASSVFFGPAAPVQIVVLQAGSTNQFDRARAVSYANNYSSYVNTDGYFWTNGSSFGTFTPGSPAPASGAGDDCAHFVSCCIGSEPHLHGGGLWIPSRATPTYGEPGAARLINNCLIGPGYAEEVFSFKDMEPGDVVGWNWEGNTNIGVLDHVTIYMGKGMLASHSASALDVSATNTAWYNGVQHLVHIFDSPTIASYKAGNNLVLSWTTNWSGYALYSAPNSVAGPWTKVTKAPKVVGNQNILTNTLSPGAAFYRLMMP